MSSHESITIANFLVNLGNNSIENFARLQDIMKEQTEKLDRIETIVKEIKVEGDKAKLLQKPESPANPFIGKVDLPFVTSTPKAADPPSQFDPVDEVKEEISPSNFKGKENSRDDEAKLKTFFLLPPDIHCFDCLRTFVRGSGEFTRHIRETTCKPYQCHCGKLFKKKSSLKAHKSTHSMDQFTCHCGAVFRCQLYLKNHQRRVHLVVKGSEQFVHITGDSEQATETVTQRLSQSKIDESLFVPMNFLKMQMNDQEE